MAGSSIPPPTPLQRQEDLKYLLYASNTNVSNFVSVKLSNEQNYHLWVTQILCLMETYNLHGIVDATLNIRPRALSPEIEKQYNSLVKGWILGSVSEELLGTLVNLGSAKDVWAKLKSFYDPTIISSQQAQSKQVEAESKSKDIDETSTERETEAEDPIPAKTTTKGKETSVTKTKGKDKISTEIQLKVEDTKTKENNKIIANKELLKAIMQGRWWEVESTLKEDKAAVREAITSDGNTVLHIAVGIGRNNIVSETLSLINGLQLPNMINLEGSTALHIAAIVGNTEGAMLLIKKNRSLLEVPDHKGETPLDKAYENMHLDTIEYLLKAAKTNGKTKKKSSPIEGSVSPGVKVGVNLLVNAVSAKQYDLAIGMVKKFPEFSVQNDNVLMAIARTFPSGLEYGETMIYPNMDGNSQRMVKIIWKSIDVLEFYFETVMELIWAIPKESFKIIQLLILVILGGPFLMLVCIFYMIHLLILMAYFPFFTLYFLLWKVSARLVAPIKHIEKKKKEWEEAKEVLKLVCDEIDKLEIPDAKPRYYTRPILEAARENAYEVVDEILMRCPEAIRYKDKSGYDIIQLAVIHRSEKIYNLIYIIGERKSVYRTIEDSCENNMLHLVGRLAPSHKLKRRRGAAFQLQRELQWREEVEKIVFPTYITKENVFKETPDKVFTREHENLVKEGEKWMKDVAETCSITAALIITIVFAAAITVPGGSNQETGIPVFREDIAFMIFAISDALSLFASTTSLLMFVSILTARCAEQDFLVILPRRLIIGLCALTLSATTMMVAFGTILFLVFCGRKPWMLAPICVSTFLPLVSFGTLGMPLILDLFGSTYARIFGKQSNKRSHRFNPNDIRLYFGK